MDTRQVTSLFITHVEKEGPFLKVWGQAEKKSSIYVEQFLFGASTLLDKGALKAPLELLKVGTLVCAKYKDSKYYRAKVLSEEYIPNFFVEVLFIDYGNIDIVPTDNVRSMHTFPVTLLSIPPLATEYIFSEAHCTGSEWDSLIFDAIAKELKYREAQCVVQLQALKYQLVKLFINGEDIGAILISKGLMKPIAAQVQQAVLLSMSAQSIRPNAAFGAAPLVAAPPTMPNELNTYKAPLLEPGQEYAVYVSFVNDGPTHFSVQLQQTEHMLAKLMKEINEINVKLLEEVPLPGTICLAKCQEDGNICRAVVTNEVDNQFKVYFVDFGNYETLPLESLYQIPFKYVLPKVMATRLTLNGIEKSSVTIDMLVAFKKFVDNRLLHMMVLPSPTVKKYVVPKCDLWDPESKVTALEVIQRAALHSYPEPLQLSKGFTQAVKVSYVFSCNRFYVQLLSKEAELTKLMDDLQISCQTADPIDPAEIKLGLPCCALFETDQLWYRAQIVDVVDVENVRVRYIDYGNEEAVPVGMLRQIEGELLTVLRPQAIECCLSGYHNMAVDEERDALWEELILEQQFTIKVYEMKSDKKAQVELIDANNYKAASLLLEKIAAAKSQVSPLLVQDGNKIEHRRTSTDAQRSDGTNENREFRQDRKPRDGAGRDNNRNWNENRQSNERSGDSTWRQDRDRNADKASNDDGSWRHNKGNREGTDRPNKRPNENNWNHRNGTSNGWNGGGRNNAPAASTEWNNKPAADSWSTTAAQPSEDSWGSKDAGVDYRTPKDNFGGRNKRYDNDRGGDRGDRGDRNRRDGFKEDGFKKRDFRKDGSETSQNDSENSFQKGPRTSSRNDHRGGNYREKPNHSFASTVTEDSWNVSALTTPIDAAPSTAVFEQLNVVGTEATVMISWFHNPTYFYCQLQSAQVSPEFRTLMEEIQEFYKNRKPETSVVGAPIIGLFPEDNVLYRAKILEILGGNYKVLYVDFGNIATITKVWPIEKKFMIMPAQAICCGLDGIAATTESWPEPSNFGKFFQKESYTTRFLYELDSRTYLELWDGQDNVAQRLVEENLALPVAPPSQSISEVDIAFLLGQQFRVVMKSVNNLADIIVALENGLALNCKMHNLDLAEETFEDVLKACLEQVLIVYVDNILEGNILEVTCYDNGGNKLVVLNPDEGALDTVEPLCPILILNSLLSGFVAHADDKAVYVQPNEHADAIANLLEAMFAAYENEPLETPIIPEEDMLYAIHSPDTNWYRGRCLSLDDSSVTVIYIDYGNTETVPFAELRELKTEFMVPHMFCVQVTLTSGTPQDYLEKDVVATIYYGESGWEGVCEVSAVTAVTETQRTTLTEAAPEVCEQQAAVEQIEQQAQEVLDQVAAEPEAAPEVCEPQPVREQVEQVHEAGIDEVLDQVTAETVQQQPDCKRTPVYVSHIDSPSQFYVQFESSTAALDELQASIQTSVTEWPVLEKISVGVLCAAPFSLDHQWYRAEVLDFDDDITTVRFIDFGNTDVISNDTTQIKTLPANLLSLALYATRCSLKLKPIDDEWSQPAIEFFESYANAEKVEAEYIIEDEKSNYIDLYADGQNIRELLIMENHAQPCEIVTESKPTCFISNLHSPSEFWVQMETCIGELEWISEQLAVAESFPELDDTSPGTLCAALYPEDDLWYRARILSQTVAGVELLFIDYGNSCVSSNLRQLPEDLLVTPPLAQKCCLQKPEGIPYWTGEARDKFIELAAEGQTIFTVRKITTEETAVVELSLNEVNVVSMILPVTEDAYVKNLENLSKFNIERNGEISSQVYELDPMPGMAWNDESVQKFIELYPEGTLFQVETIDERTVRLYVNGSDIRPNLGGEKVVHLIQGEDENPPSTSDEFSNAKDVHIKTEMIDTPVEPDSQYCDTRDSEIRKTVKNADVVRESDGVIVDVDARESKDSTADSGRHSEASEEAPVGEPNSELVRAEKDVQSGMVSEEICAQTENELPETVEKDLKIASSETIRSKIIEPTDEVDIVVDSDVAKAPEEVVLKETEKQIADDTDKDSKNGSTEDKVSESTAETESTAVDPTRSTTTPSEAVTLESTPDVTETRVVVEKESAEVENKDCIVEQPTAQVTSNGETGVEKAAATGSDELDFEVQSVVNKNGYTNGKVRELRNEETVDAPASRPSSRPSSRLSFDERILPAVVSRPHSPIPLSPDDAS